MLSWLNRISSCGKSPPLKNNNYYIPVAVPKRFPLRNCFCLPTHPRYISRDAAGLPSSILRDNKQKEASSTNPPEHWFQQWKEHQHIWKQNAGNATPLSITGVCTFDPSGTYTWRTSFLRVRMSGSTQCQHWQDLVQRSYPQLKLVIGPQTSGHRLCGTVPSWNTRCKVSVL